MHAEISVSDRAAIVADFAAIKETLELQFDEVLKQAGDSWQSLGFTWHDVLPNLTNVVGDYPERAYWEWLCELSDEARRIVDGAKRDGRDLTATECARFGDLADTQIPACQRQLFLKSNLIAKSI